MKTSQAGILAVAAVAVVVVFLIGRGDDPGRPRDKPASPRGALVVPFVYSPEKEKLLAPLIRQFNRRGARVGAKRVFIDGRVVSSGEAEEKIARRRLRSVAWSPASSLWGRLLNFDADRAYVSRLNPSIVRTPLVIAMWEPMARALSYPRKPVGFSDILHLASSREGWRRYGHSEFGDFKLVHTNPDFSTSGLSAVVAEYYAATGKRGGLRESDVAGSGARRIVRGIERSIVHYGDTTLFIADQMKKGGAGYASAVAMEEVTLLDFNRTRGSRDKLIAIYPREGTFDSDNPFLVLDAPWVSREERAGAHAFQRFLAAEVTPARAARSGFRPASRNERPVAPVTRRNGVDPRRPAHVLGLPQPRVLNRIRSAWREDRKPANVMLVVDTSNSMENEGRLENAKDGLKVFFNEVSPRDRVGLITFSDLIRQRVPPGRPFRETGPKLRRIVKGLEVAGGTAFYDATAEGLRSVRRLGDESRINAVVVLTDGEDTDSGLSTSEVIERVSHQDDSAPHVRVFTIAYGADAQGAANTLRRIARGAGGQDYEGTTGNIESVYRSISSFF
jgi:Ca-activated chloride channel homolog